MVRVLLIDDQEEIREAMEMLLSVQEGIEVVGVANSGYEGILKAEKTQADVILTDLRMPGINGIETTQEILKRSGEKRPKVLLMTAFDDDEYILQAVEAGASGYLLKDTEIEDVANAIRLVYSEGSKQFADKLERRILDRLKPYSSRGKTGEVKFMTEREANIVTLIKEGLTDNEIAERMRLSTSEVQNHIENIKTNFQLADRDEVIAWCQNQNIMN